MGNLTFGPWDGALLIDKPQGPTSHDVVDAVRRHTGVKKVGHCGALDPNATGLLLLVLGKATRLSNKLIASDKAYEGTIKFGETTDSYDAEGKVIATRPVPPLTVEKLNELAKEFTGDLMQIPPMVSAAKVKGIPLYKLARRGLEVERKPRLVHVYLFRFTRYEEPFGDFVMKCTKGTYVRSIAHELGEKIGCGAHLYALRRTEIGPFHVDRAIPLEEALRLPQEELQKRLIPILDLAAVITQQESST